jgi:hypothetical protein
MTKFTDRLETNLSNIADQASPSPTAWQAIQQRLAEPEPNHARDIIMLTDEREQVDTSPDRRWLAVAAAVAVGVLAIGAFAATRGDDEVVVTDDPPAEVDDNNADDTNEGDGNEDSAPDTTVAPETEATPLLAGLPVSGLTTTEDLGMTLTFEVSEPMQTTFVEPGFFSLVKPSDVNEDIGIFVASRVGGWYDADQSVDNAYRGEGSIPANDVEGWIEANQHIADRLPDATVSGRTARVYDIEIDETVEGSLFDDCDRCVLTASPSSEFFNPGTAQSGDKVINPGLKLRLWFIEVDGFDPIAIWAAGFGSEATFIDEFEATILPTIEIGPDAGPLTVLPAGPTPILPGLPLSAGLVQSDLLGETLLMELPEDMTVAYARPGEIQLNGTTEVPMILVIARVGGWYSGTEAIDNTYRGEGSIDAGDPQAWIDDNGVIGERRPGFLEVSGRIATIWDITIDPAFEGSLYDDCPQCMLVYSVSSEFFEPGMAQEPSRTINADVTMRMFFFEGAEGADPFVFFAASVGDDTSFIDEFESDILPTVQFEAIE